MLMDIITVVLILSFSVKIFVLMKTTSMYFTKVIFRGYARGVGLFEKIIQAACYRICPGQFINRERDQPHGEYETVAHIRIARNAYIELKICPEPRYYDDPDYEKLEFIQK